MITINGFSDGMIIYLRAETAGHIITVKETGNIELVGGPFAMVGRSDFLVLLYDADQAKWMEIARSHGTWGSALTIATGVVTALKPYHTLTPQTGTADDVDTINGFWDGYLLTLRVSTSGDTITLKNGTGNLDLGADIVITNGDLAQLIYDGLTAKWVVFSATSTPGAGTVTFSMIQNITSDRLLGRDTPGSGSVEEISVDSTLEFSGSQVLRRAAITGDVTINTGFNAATIANNAVTLAKMADMNTDKLLGRDTVSTGDPEEISLNATLEFTGSGSIQRAALTGDVTATAGSNATTIPNDTVTFAKIQNVADSTIAGRAAGAGTGDLTALTAAQVLAILGLAPLYQTLSAVGNVGTGEDTLASYTLSAGILATDGDSIWFEAFGTTALAVTITIRVRFGSSGTNLVYSEANSSWGSYWSVKGRIYRTGASSQKSDTTLISDNDDRVEAQVVTGLNQTLSGSITLSVTGEAVLNNDVVLEGFRVGYTPAP